MEAEVKPIRRLLDDALGSTKAAVSEGGRLAPSRCVDALPRGKVECQGYERVPMCADRHVRRLAAGGCCGSIMTNGILDTAKKADCDLIVMASHGRRGLGRILLGSEAVKVLTHSTVPVLICR